MCYKEPWQEKKYPKKRKKPIKVPSMYNMYKKVELVIFLILPLFYSSSHSI